MSFASQWLLGRSDVLARLQALASVTRVVVIAGLPGVGTSSVANGFCRARTGPVIVTDAVADLDAMLRGMRPQGDRSLDAFAAHLDASETTWLVEHLERLCVADRVRLLDGLGARLQRGMVLATSRERIPSYAVGLGWAEVVVGGLDEHAARALWQRLDTLHGTVAAFEDAWGRVAGHPALLVKLHSRVVMRDAVSALLEKLPAPALELLRALVVAEAGVPAAVIAQLPGAGAVDTLRASCIVHIDAGGDVHVDPTCAGLLRASVDADGWRESHAALAAALAHAPWPFARRVAERVRHELAAERYRDAVSTLLASERALVRSGGARTLLRHLDAIPIEHRCAEVRMAIARMRLRTLDFRRAFAEQSRLLATLGTPPPHLLLSLGRTAVLVGNLEVADGCFSRVLAMPDLAPTLRVLAVCGLVLVQMHRGDMQGALEHIDRAEREISDPVLAGRLAFYRVVVLWFLEIDDIADAAVDRANNLLAQGPSSHRTARVCPALFAAVIARRGRVQLASEMLRAADRSIANHEDPLLAIEVDAMRACVLLDSGLRIEALDLFSSLAARLERAGYEPGALWARARAARILMLVGRRYEATRALTQLRATADAAGLNAVALVAARGLEHDPAVSPGVGSRTGWGKRDESRDEAWRALREASRGDERAVDIIAMRLTHVVARRGYELERAMLVLARAVAARICGHLRAASAYRTEAQRIAGEGDVDPDVLDDIVRGLGRLRVTTSDATSLVDDWTARDGELVVDATLDEIRFARRTCSLARRTSLRRLLYCLAGSPNRPVSRDDLSQALWGTDYDPLVHEQPLRMNITNLRKLLAPFGLRISFEGDAYRVDAPGHLVFVEQWTCEGGTASTRGVVTAA